MSVTPPYMNNTGASSTTTVTPPVSRVSSIIVTGSTANRVATMTLTTTSPAAYTVGQTVTISGIPTTGAPNFAGINGSRALVTAVSAGGLVVQVGVPGTVPTGIRLYLVPAGQPSLQLPSYQQTVTTPATQQLTISGDAFGARGANSAVTLTPLAGGTSNVTATINSWSNNEIKVTIASNSSTVAPTPGAYQLAVRNTNGKTSVNGLTFHVLGGTGTTAYTPTVIQVNKPTGAPTVPGEINANALSGAVVEGDPNSTPENILQLAVDRAATVTSGRALVVVWPKTPVANNPQGEYYENLVVHSNVKIQGVGPGGTYLDAARATKTVSGHPARRPGLQPGQQRRRRLGGHGGRDAARGSGHGPGRGGRDLPRPADGLRQDGQHVLRRPGRRDRHGRLAGRLRHGDR